MELRIENAECRIPEGYKKTEVGVIPEDWGLHFLADEISSLDAGISVNSIEGEVHIGDYAVLKTSAVFQGKFNPLESKKIKRGDIKRAKLNPKANSLIISRMNTPELVGECGYVDKNYNTVFIPDRLWQTTLARNSLMDCKWLNYVLNTDAYRKKVKDSATGTSNSMKNISKEQILHIQIPYPNPVEQKVIANALSDIDSLISSLEKLIWKKESIKQGAMQELLTGKRRLSGFSGDWEKKTLGEICEIRDGTHQTPKYVYSGIPFYSVENVTQNDFENTKFISEYEHSLLTKSYRIEKGDILMTRIGSIGDCKYIDWDVNASFYVSLALLKVRKIFSGRFICHYSNTDYFKKEIDLNSLQSAIPRKINLGQISNIGLIIPPTKEEQTAIAEILSDMDDEIDKLIQKLNKYKNMKQGMMQELLTGRRRLV